jgi:hypothetical protein
VALREGLVQAGELSSWYAHEVIINILINSINVPQKINVLDQGLHLFCILLVEIFC